MKKRLGTIALILALVLAALPASQAAPAAPSYTVTNTNNSGPGSLRQAMLNVNAAGGGGVAFNIPSSDGFCGHWR